MTGGVGMDAPARMSVIDELFRGVTEERMRTIVAGEGVLFEAARYHLETGGKRLRALLPSWVCHSLGQPTEDAVRLGAALELIHNGTLVHDDLQDGDTQRRGRPTVWVRYGMAQAVNVGTALILLGIAEVLRTPVGAAVIADIDLAVLGVIDGQARELELHGAGAPTLAAWERMAAGKTGELFGACFLAGARAARRDDATSDALAGFGRAVGVLFQLQDDLLDLVGDKGRDQPATDIAEGKISWPVAWAAVHAEEGARARVLEIVKAPREETTGEMIAEAVGLLGATGALTAARAELERRALGLLQAPENRLVPGLVAKVLVPVAHVLEDPRLVAAVEAEQATQELGGASV